MSTTPRIQPQTLRPPAPEPDRLPTVRPMRRLADAVRTEPRPHHVAAVRGVAEIAVAWAEGSLGSDLASSLVRVRALCSGHERWVCAWHSRPEDPWWPALMVLLDALIAAQPVFVDGRGGVWPLAQVHAVEGRVEVRDGKPVAVAFPVRHPWRIKPDRERGVVGERAPAEFRRPEERGPRYPRFDTAPQPAAAAAAPAAWWDRGA